LSEHFHAWRIVYLSMPVRGHVNPTLPIVRELVQRGIQVDYFALERFRKGIQETGAVFHNYSSRFTIPERGLGPFVNPDTIVDMLLELADIVLEDDLERIRSLEPTCVMHDSLGGWGRYVAQILKLPEVASLATFAVNSPQMALAQFADSPDSVPMTQKMTAKMPGWIARLTTLNQRFGISGINSPLELMQSFGELSLVYTSKAFQPKTQVFDEQRFKFIGPTVSSHPDGPPFPFEALTGRPLLCIALGTVYQGRGDFLRTCIEAFRNTRWQVVMASGEDLSAEGLASVPENFLVRPTVPRPDILKRAAIFITDGGMDSVSDALWYGVPMLVSPGGVDEFQIADRVVELGAGQNLTGLEVTPELLRERVEQIAAQPAYAVASAKAGEDLRAAGGARRGADEIEAFLARKAGSAIISSWLTNWTLRHGAGEFVLPFGWIAKP
jgi:MGT family glycosyltransferase